MDSFQSTSVRENIQNVQDRIASAAQRVGRDVNSIELVAISKTKPVSLIDEAIDSGITDIGENRVQEARNKHSQVNRPVRWHLVGHLQTNKVKQALQIFNSFGRQHTASGRNQSPLLSIESSNKRADRSQYLR